MTQLPEPPQGVSAKWSGTNLQVSWSPSASSVTAGYAINVSSDGGTTWQGILPWVTGRSTTSALVPGLNQSKSWKVRVRSMAGGNPSPSVAVAAVVVEPPPPPPEEEKTPPPPPTEALWAADGSKGGSTNNIYLEWESYLGPHWKSGNKHECINLVPFMDAAHGSHPPLNGKDMYRFEYKYCGPGGGQEGPSWGGPEEDRLEVSNGQNQGQAASLPTGLTTSGFYQWTEGAHGFIAHSFYFPILPQVESKLSEDPIGRLPLNQLHGAGGVPPFFGLGVRETQSPARYDGRPYKPTLKAQTGITDWSDNEQVKPGIWYRTVIEYYVSADSTKGTARLWLAKGATAPFVKVIDAKGKTLTASFMYPCMGGPRNEATKVPPAEVPTEIVYHKGMLLCPSLAVAEAVQAAA